MRSYSLPQVIVLVLLQVLCCSCFGVFYFTRCDALSDDGVMKEAAVRDVQSLLRGKLFIGERKANNEKQMDKTHEREKEHEEVKEIVRESVEDNGVLKKGREMLQESKEERSFYHENEPNVKPTNKDDDVITFNSSMGVEISGPASDHCSRLTIPLCPTKEPRDILFLIDASNSVDREYFYSKTLDAARDIICAFDPTSKNQFGLILFNKEISEVIKLAPYTHQQWETQIEKIRSNDTICCSCCTPIAEAFDLAKKVLTNRGKNQWSIVFAQTDGVPYQNTGEGAGKYSFPRMDPAMYAMDQVPKSASRLKDTGARIMIVGVKRGTEEGHPDCDYFKGIPNKKLRQGHSGKMTQCIARAGTDNYSCMKMKKPPFPIVSMPVYRNAFCLTAVDEIIAETIESICLPPTPPPPTRKPSASPIRSPSATPSLKPSRNPTNTPSKVPTQFPSRRPTAFPTTRTPSKLPTASPAIKIDFTSLDLYFVLDRSGSMDDYTSFCLTVPRRNHYISELPIKSCWGVLLDFTESLALAAANIGIKYPMGWKSDWPPMQNNAGLRVTVLAFSCHNNMKTPLTHVIADRVESFSALQGLLKNAYQNLRVNGGTCPSEAIDKVIRNSYLTDPVSRPFKALIYISDGITSPKNQRDTVLSSKGLPHFDISTYAIGIAVPRGTRTFGLTPEEMQQQKNQLIGIAGGNENNMFSLYDDNAFSTLSLVIDKISTKIVNDIIIAEPYYEPYCGYTTRDICLDDPVNCKWNMQTQLCNYVDQQYTRAPSSLGSGDSKSCEWNITDVGEYEQESNPYDLCSTNDNSYDCSERNYCCWNEEEQQCNIPSACDAECSILVSPEICKKSNGCCFWNYDESICQRACIGGIDEVCGANITATIPTILSPTLSPTVASTMEPT